MTDLDIVALRDYIQTLDETDFRSVVNKMLEIRCGYSQIRHSPSEHGMDISALYEKQNDFVSQDITVLVQVKVGILSPADLRHNIFGQMSELFVREITEAPFHPWNPRRLLLITSGRLGEEARNLINNWNDKMPLPIEVFDGQRVAEFLYDDLKTKENVERIVNGEEPILEILPEPKRSVVGQE